MKPRDLETCFRPKLPYLAALRRRQALQGLVQRVHELLRRRLLHDMRCFHGLIFENAQESKRQTDIAGVLLHLVLVRVGRGRSAAPEARLEYSVLESFERLCSWTFVDYREPTEITPRRLSSEQLLREPIPPYFHIPSERCE